MGLKHRGFEEEARYEYELIGLETIRLELNYCFEDDSIYVVVIASSRVEYFAENVMYLLSEYILERPE